MRVFPLLLALLAASAATAEPTTHRLTEAQKQAILAARTEADLATPTDLPRLIDRQPHGEIGILFGSGGTRGIYGVTSVPLGENGWASFGIENSRTLWPGRY